MVRPQILAAAGLLWACGEAKPRIASVLLSTAGDTVLTQYADVPQGVWLAGDRWAILAPDDDAVALVDFARSAPRRLGGTKGSALRNPSTLFSAADTVYVGDWGLRRTTVWTEDGRLIDSLPAGDAVRGTLPKARDSLSRFYLDLYPPAGPDGSGNRDSAAVLRTDDSFRRVDTVARLAPLDLAEVRSEQGRRFERRVFSGVDQWGVLLDGSLWVARVYHNRVDWRSPDGTWTRGEDLPDRVLEVTRYDRELFVRRFPPELRNTAQQLPFAPIKPPFEAGMTSPAGEVWLEKSRAPADSTRNYHVVNRQGRLVREVRLPGQGQIIAVGSTAALAAEPTREGIRLLQIQIPGSRGERDTL